MAEQLTSERSIFLTAMEKDPGAERAAYLDEACRGDERLRTDIEALLAAHDRLPPSPGPGGAETIEGPMTLNLPGTLIGRYKLLETIGEGAHGTVYMAEQTSPVQRKVALKIIKAGMDTRQVIARFEAERQALALMDHPSIAKVFDAGVTETGRPYFVMELVKGAPITRYCDEKRLTPRERLELFVHVCQAVQHAHQKGIIHRDLKPNNVLVAQYDGKPVPKVIDFGVAKATGQRLTEKTMFTGFGDVIGTPQYMSPEQADLNQLDIDTRSDIYSLGVVLYELLTGTTPLEHNRLKQAALLEVLRVIREDEPPRPSTRLSTAQGLPDIAASRGVEPRMLTGLVHGELDWIVMKALEKDRSRRYETANGLAMDLHRYLKDEPVHACPPSAAYRVRKFVRRNRGPVLAGASIVVLLTAGVVGTTLGLMRARAEANAKGLQWERAEKNAAAAKRQEIEALKQKQEAEEQAAIARAVVKFLNDDVFQQASVWVQEGMLEAPPDRDLKVRDALDRAAARIPGRFEKQPLIEAATRHVMGWTYRHVGDLPKAEAHLSAALRLRRQVLGEQHTETFRTLYQLGCVHLDVGDMALAEQELGQGLEGLRRTLGEQNVETLFAMRYLALLHRLQKHYAKAEPLTLKLLETQRNIHGDEHPTVLIVLNDLAALYSDEGKYAEAEALLAQVLEGRRRVRGERHPETLLSLLTLANVYSTQGLFDKAEPIYLQTVEGMRQVLGEQHPLALNAASALARLYLRQKRYANAEPLFLQVLEGRRKVFGEQHPQTLHAMNSLAWLYHHQKQYAKAEPLHLQALEGRRKVFGEQHPETLEAMNSLAVLYQNQERYAEAERMYRQLLATQRTVLGAQGAEVAKTLTKIAASLRSQDKLADAEPLFREALAMQRKVMGSQHADVASTLDALAGLVRSQKNLSEAEQLYREALEIRRNVLGPDQREVAQALFNLANLLLSQQRYAEAEPLAREGLEIRQSAFPRGDWLIAVGKSVVGAAISGQGKYEEAERLLLAAHQELQAQPPPPSQAARTREVLNRIVRHYESWGKKEEAAQWRAKLSAE